jgi:2-polyprenyl-3-methyl-5-hydroxy-6-metoxy-1,4-benzoquinol methylase
MEEKKAGEKMIATHRKEKQAEYYNSVYLKAAEYKKHWSQSRYLKLYQLIASFLPADVYRETKIVDAGCGCGQLLAMLYESGWKNIIGIDYSITAINQAKSLFPQCSHLYEQVDITSKIPYGFHTAIFSEVLEHIEEDVKLITRYKEFFKQIILTVPSFDDPAHVRYFKAVADVEARYAQLFTSYTCQKAGAWFVFNGTV